MKSAPPTAEPELALGLPMSAQVPERRALEVLIDTIPDAMVIIDEDGTIIAYSPRAEAMFGYSIDEVRGENVSLLMPSPDREHHDSYIRRYLATGEHRIIGVGRIVNGRRKNGTVFPLHLCVGDARADDRPLFVGYMHDVSKRAKMRSKLLELQSEIAHVGRIAQAGTLATAIAHELNQPLTAISNYVEAASSALGEATMPRADLEHALANCAHEVQRAGEILRRWRSFIRGGLQEREYFDLKGLVDEALALALADGDGEGVHASSLMDPDLPKVFVGGVEIQQVIVNLLRNALESTRGQASRMIIIGARCADEGMVEVAISDNGPGIDGGMAQRLFQPFETTKKEGMGLGLSISHTIVDAHGGRIWAEPSEFGGTTFRFTIPARKEELM